MRPYVIVNNLRLNITLAGKIVSHSNGPACEGITSLSVYSHFQSDCGAYPLPKTVLAYGLQGLANRMHQKVICCDIEKLHKSKGRHPSCRQHQPSELQEGPC